MYLHSEKRFKKQYTKLSKKIQKRFIDRVQLFVEDPHSSILRVHTLKGDKVSMKNMNISGDYRALFTVKKNTIIFYEIGTHSELYE